MSIDFTEKAKRYQAIDELCEKYAAPIDTDVETNGYFYTDPKYRLWGENQRIIKGKNNPEFCPLVEYNISRLGEKNLKKNSTVMKL